MRFYELLEKKVNEVTQGYMFDVLNPDTMRNIRNSIITLIDTTFSKSSNNISHQAKVWLADQYFKNIRINESILMSDQVVINEYRLQDMPERDINLLHALFKQSFLGDQLIDEHKRRHRKKLS